MIVVLLLPPRGGRPGGGVGAQIPPRGQPNQIGHQVLHVREPESLGAPGRLQRGVPRAVRLLPPQAQDEGGVRRGPPARWLRRVRSEEHTSELQSLRHLVCRLLLEKKKNKNTR